MTRTRLLPDTRPQPHANADASYLADVAARLRERVARIPCEVCGRPSIAQVGAWWMCVECANAEYARLRESLAAQVDAMAREFVDASEAERRKGSG